MNPWILEQYLKEIGWQCRLAELAWTDLRLARNAEDETRQWLAIQGFLGAAASISKMLWPGGNRDQGKQKHAESRAKKLRAHLEVSDLTALRSRKLRDHFEHFDERLDDWAQAKLPYFRDRETEPAGAPVARITNVDGHPVKSFRVFEDHSTTVTFGDETHALKPIRDSIERIRIQLQGGSPNKN